MAKAEPLFVTQEQAIEIRWLLGLRRNITGPVTVTAKGFNVHPQPAPTRPATTTSTRFAFVKPTANASGGGKYTGVGVSLASATLPLTGNLSAAEIGSVTNTFACTIINPHEEGKSTHGLTVGTPVCHHFLAYRRPGADSNGQVVYIIIAGLDTKVCT